MKYYSKKGLEEEVKKIVNGSGGNYTAGDGIDITDGEISIDDAYITKINHGESAYNRVDWSNYFGIDDQGDIYVLNNKGFYSYSFVSAGGRSSGGGGGEGVTLQAVWNSLEGNSDSFANHKINAYHIPIGSGLEVDTSTTPYTIKALGAVTSVVGQTGAVTAAQIGSALETAGYALTDTTYSAGTGLTLTGTTFSVTANTYHPYQGSSSLKMLASYFSLGQNYTPSGGSATESKLEWDDTYKAWHLIGNFYADGWISAGGISSGGGSASGNASYIKIDANSGTLTNGSDSIVVVSKDYVDTQGGKVQTVAGVSPSNGDIPAASLASALGTGSVTSGNTYLVTGGTVYSAISSAVSSVLKFVGTTTSDISDGSTTNPIIINNESYTAVTGNVVLKGNKEFLWNGTSWEEMGDEASWALKTVTITGTGYLTGGGTLESNRTIDIAQTYKGYIDEGHTVAGYFDNSGKITSGHLPDMYIGKTKVVFSNSDNVTLLGISGITYTGSASTANDKSKIEWDATANSGEGAWHFLGNIYADGFISAGGLSPGGGASGTTLQAVWDSLTGNSSPYTDTRIHPAHLLATDSTASTGLIIGAGLSYDSSTRVLSATGTTYTAGTGITIDSSTHEISVTDNTYASYSHTHTTSIATSTGTNQITLAFGSKYALTAGGTSYVFTMPVNPDTNTTYKVTLNGTVKGDSTNGVDLGTYSISNGVITIGSGTTITPVTNVAVGGTGYTDKLAITAGGSTTYITVPFATTASKLSTVSKTAWGRTYWTSGGVPDSISGDMSSVGNITPSANNSKNLGSSSAFWANTYSSKFYLNANTYFELDSDGYVHLVHPSGKGFYADGFVSAGGVSSGGGTGGIDLPAMWTSLANTTITNPDANTQIATAHLTTALSGYLPLTAGSGNSLTGQLYITLSNTSTTPNIIAKSGLSTVSYLDIRCSDNKSANVGFISGSNWGVADYGGAYLFAIGNSHAGGLFVNSDGVFYTDSAADLDKYTIWHSGNAYISSNAVTIGSNTVGSVSAPIGYSTYANALTRRNGSASSGGYDLNTMLNGGGITSQYGSSGYWANGPSGMSYGGVMEFTTSYTGYASGISLNIQFAWDVYHNVSTPTRKLWFRSANNLGWASDWKEIYHSGNFSVTLNGTSTTSASFYAPTSAGSSSSQLCVWSTTSSAPAWATGNLGSATQPVYVSGGVLTAGTALGTMAYATEANYLPLSAGSGKSLTGQLYITLSNTSTTPDIVAKAGTSNVSYLDIRTSDNKSANVGFISGSGWGVADYGGAYLFVTGNSHVGGVFVNSDGVYYTDSASDLDKYTVWHSGNDGASSGLDADLLDGQHGSYYNNLLTFYDSGTTSADSVTYPLALLNSGTPSTSWHYVTTMYYNAVGSNYASQIATSFNSSSPAIWIRQKYSTWTDWAGVWTTANAGSTSFSWSAASINLPNGTGAVNWKDSGGTNRTFLNVNSSNQLVIGYGTIANSATTFIYGSAITFNTGSSGTEYMRINSSGNVGIGTSSPSFKLHVVTDSVWAGQFSNTKSGVWISHVDGYGVYVGSKDSSSTYSLIETWYGQSSLGSGGTSAFRVLCNGLVGIGISNPSHKLHVTGASTSQWNGLFTSDKSCVYLSHGNDYGAYIGTAATAQSHYALTVRTGQTTLTSGGTMAFFIGGDGRVGVGTETPSTSGSLDVNGAIISKGLYVNSAATATATGIAFWGTYSVTKWGIFMSTTANYGTHGDVSGDYAVYFTMNNTAHRGWIFRNESTGGVFSISAAGNAACSGAITAGSASDSRLKTNISTLSDEDAKKLVMALRPVTFTWNEKATELYDQYKGNDLGFIAQEVEGLLPQAIGSIFTDYKRLDQTKFIAPLVCVAKNHETRLEEAERRIEVLEKENMELKKQLRMN